MKLDGEAMQVTKVQMSGALLTLFKRSGYYEAGAENAPFFSEAFLYNLVGKDEARRILSDVGYYSLRHRRDSW